MSLSFSAAATWRLLLHRLRLVRLRTVTRATHHLDSDKLGRSVRLDVYLPPAYRRALRYPLLLINDGQDLEEVGLQATLEQLYHQRALPPVLVVGIYANERRMREYGVAAQPDYKGRGDLAGAYTAFVLDELLPFLQQRYPYSERPQDVYFAGFSLGALSAFDIVWHHPRRFGGVGVFSGALWWRSRAFNPRDPDADRILHAAVQAGQDHHPHLRFWFQAGTHDETSDRNQNGVIDAIDDTLDLMYELEARGYRRGIDFTYVEVDGGQHNQATWGKVMGVFLRWAFG